MIFNSIEFLVFLPVVFIAYWLLQGKPVLYQNILILLASYIFYSWWDWRFLSLIGISTIADFILGKKIEFAETPTKRKVLLVTSLMINLGILGFFKYYNFFISSFQTALQNAGINIETWTLNIILPVGISFYTFQTLSYSIDIYNGKIKSTKNFISFASFVAFFPQLVAGPIERAKNLLPQFEKSRIFDSYNAINGVTLIVYGLFRKIVIADRLALYVNSVFNDIESANTISLVIAVFFFSFQIYCDFSGYSLIAKGVAKLFGFEIMTNFKKPYLAVSLPDFWRRWHISLSTWFRDYLYIPLGGNRVSTQRIFFNIMVVFLISGLWHGANWTFIFWGFIHGLFQILYLIYWKLKKPIANQNVLIKYLNILFVFSIVCFAWIFFRAQTIEEAFFYISKIFEFDFSINIIQLCAKEGPLNLVLSFMVIGLLLISYAFHEDLKFKKLTHYISFNIILIFLIIILGIDGEPNFIYFQF